MKQWDHQSAEERYTVQIVRNGKPVVGIQSDRISSVEEEVMYWRKANQIHGWFVENVQSGEDDCGNYFIKPEKVLELLDTCNKVIASSIVMDGKIVDDAVARSLLPVTEGFFFGTYEYDEYYLSDVIATRDWSACMIEDEKRGVPGQLYYHSSW